MTYKHLSQEERYQIYILMSAGNSQKQIAERLRVIRAVEVIDLDKPVCWLRNGLWDLVMLHKLLPNSGLRPWTIYMISGVLSQ